MGTNKPKKPIMSKDDERFMAYCGLIQWTESVILQSRRVVTATEQLMSVNSYVGKSIYALHCEQHYFVISANKLLEYRQWVKSFGLFDNVDFNEIDAFSIVDVQDLRNMREHIVEYFQGSGHLPIDGMLRRQNIIRMQVLVLGQ
jgi:hypothetical protein